MNSRIHRVGSQGAHKLPGVIKIASISLLSLFALTGQFRSGVAARTAMQDVREAAKNQQLTILELRDKSGITNAIFVSYNNLQPLGFCYSFLLKGNWETIEDRLGTRFLADSRKSSLSFSVISRKELTAESDGGNFEGAASLLEREYTETRGIIDPKVSLSSSRQWLSSADQKVLIWRAKLDGNQVGDHRRITIPAHYLFPVPGGQMLNLRIGSSLGVDREDAIARGFIEHFVTTENPECFFPALRTWFTD